MTRSANSQSVIENCPLSTEYEVRRNFLRSSRIIFGAIGVSTGRSVAQLGWRARLFDPSEPLLGGIAKTYEWFLKCVTKNAK